MIRILLADDHQLILRGVRELLSSLDDMEVVGEEVDAKNIADAVGRLEPDVLIQDLSMPGQVSCIDVIRHVSERYPRTKIVVLSMHAMVASVWEAMEQGASGYVTKLGDMEELVRAVRAVHRGDRFIGKPLSEAEVDEYARMARAGRTRSLSALTKREREVLTMVAHGHTSSEIADKLNIGRRTVESHRANLASKLGLRNQAELVRYAMERGMVQST